MDPRWPLPLEVACPSRGQFDGLSGRPLAAGVVAVAEATSVDVVPMSTPNPAQSSILPPNSAPLLMLQCAREHSPSHSCAPNWKQYHAVLPPALLGCGPPVLLSLLVFSHPQALSRPGGGLPFWGFLEPRHTHRCNICLHHFHAALFYCPLAYHFPYLPPMHNLLLVEPPSHLAMSCCSTLSLPHFVLMHHVSPLSWPASARARARFQCFSRCNTQTDRTWRAPHRVAHGPTCSMSSEARIREGLLEPSHLLH